MIRAFNDYIGVKEVEHKDNSLFISDSVGLERVKIVTLPDEVRQYFDQVNDYSIGENTEVYIKIDSSKPTPYIRQGNDKLFFIKPEDIVAVDSETVKYKEIPDTNCSDEKVEVK